MSHCGSTYWWLKHKIIGDGNCKSLFISAYMTKLAKCVKIEKSLYLLNSLDCKKICFPFILMKYTLIHRKHECSIFLAFISLRRFLHKLYQWYSMLGTKVSRWGKTVKLVAKYRLFHFFSTFLLFRLLIQQLRSWIQKTQSKCWGFYYLRSLLLLWSLNKHMDGIFKFPQVSAFWLHVTLKRFQSLFSLRMLSMCLKPLPFFRK